MDRLPISEGADPELWVQLDLRYPDRIGYTISLRANGTIRLQFQHMSVPPFDAVDARRRIYDAVAALPGLSVKENLTGLPSFRMASLDATDNLDKFIRILEHAVDQMVEAHRRNEGSHNTHNAHDWSPGI